MNFLALGAGKMLPNSLECALELSHRSSKDNGYEHKATDSRQSWERGLQQQRNRSYCLAPGRESFTSPRTESLFVRPQLGPVSWALLALSGTAMGRTPAPSPLLTLPFLQKHP